MAHIDDCVLLYLPTAFWGLKNRGVCLLTSSYKFVESTVLSLLHNSCRPFILDNIHQDLTHVCIYMDKIEGSDRKQ